MALFSRFFKHTEEVPRPELGALLEERSIPSDLPGLAELIKDFDHFTGPERVAYLDAVAELHQAGIALPEPWKFAQYEVLPELVPHWVGEREAFFHRPYCEGLTLRVRLGDHRLTRAWAVLFETTMEEVLDQALYNLREKAKESSFDRLPSGIYKSTFHDPFAGASALLLLPEFWDHLFPGQNHFLAIPTPDTLLVAPQILLPKLLEATTQIIGATEQVLLATLLTQVEKKLVPANMQDPHPIAQPQRELRQLDLLQALRAQDQDLDPSAQGLAAPMPLGTLRNNQGRTLTYATWTEGGPIALPEVDLIAFMKADGEPLGIYFRQTLPRIHEFHSTAIPIWGPRRSRYDGFPNAEQLARLEVFATAEQMKAMGQQQTAKAAPRPTTPAAANALNTPGGAQGMVQAAAPLPKNLLGAGLGVQGED
ncbi:MAG: hypothetical protein KGN80_04675 [Acidobacteriota bacterium]|nr:hypothetical protein [Acidobacteriota bacterium]